MKSIPIIFLLFLFACGKSSTTPEIAQQTGQLFLEVEHAFDDDLTILLLDGDELLNDEITTNYTISLAWSTIKTLPVESQHQILVNLPHAHVQQTFTFTMAETTSVFVRYAPETKKLSFATANLRILRD